MRYAQHAESIQIMIDPIYTYNFYCKKDKSTMNLEISKKLDYIPSCLKCNSNMIIRYSINEYGELWMNSAIMHE
jgi:NAD-dependent SIR2 family protein deacetylase